MEETKKRRKKLHDVSLEKDIKFRGPLSYRHLKIIGWLCIAAAQAKLVLSLAQEYLQNTIAIPDVITAILEIMISLIIPLFLLSNFSRILDSRDGYRRQILVNGLTAAVIAVLFIFFYYHYVVGVFSAANGTDTVSASITLKQFFSKGENIKYINFNFFVDFFLCALFMFFLNYRPKSVFIGKKLLIFRCFSVLPLLYEIDSLVLKYLAQADIIHLPVFVYPFFTAKPLIMFLVFIVLAVFIKNRERLFCLHGRTHKEYIRFLGTNRNSLHFSIFAAVVFAAAGVVNMLADVILQRMHSTGSLVNYDIISSLALGSGYSELLTVAPFILLYSYTRKYKSILADLFIPVGGICIIVLFYLECIYRVFIHLFG